MELPILPSSVNGGMFSIYTRSHLIKNLSIKNNQIFYQGEPIKDKKKKKVEVDSSSFRALSYGFFADKNRGYGLTHIIKSNSTTICLTPFNFDVNSFEVINLDYAKDITNTYFADGARVIKGTNYTPLKIGTPRATLNQMENLSETDIWQSDFVLNTENVYYRGKLLKDALPNSFRRLDNYWYKDDVSVFLKNGLAITKEPKLHARSFIALGSMDGTDKYNPIVTIFHNNAHESLIDQKNYKDFFENHPELSDYWYFEAIKKKEAQQNLDPLPLLAHGFYQLGNEIFYKNRVKDVSLTRILNTTSDNFKFLSENYATNGKSIFLIRDEYWSFYKRFREIKVNKSKIEVLSVAFVYDGTYFYYKAFKKFKADRSSFVVLNHIHAYDKNGLIVEGVRKKDVIVTKNVKSIGGAYIKIDDTFYYMGKSRNKSKIDDSRVKIINDFIVIGADGSAFNHGKYRKYIGDFNKFKQLENGNFGDGILEWKIGDWGLEPAI